MTPFRRFQLSFLFFLEFFIWGGWFVTMGTFLSQEFNASGSQLALAYETQSIGAIIAPFVVGLIADRYFEAQKIFLSDYSDDYGRSKSESFFDDFEVAFGKEQSIGADSITI